MKYAFIVAQFITLWLVSLAVVFVLAFLMNVDWARPQIEKQMAESFHRTVKLGRLSWNLGLNGLAIATDHMELDEHDGKPFFTAAQSEIGVAFFSLLHGEVKIKHLSFIQPELWLTKIRPDKWNYSDLMQPGPEIHYIEWTKGKLHIADDSGAKGWNPYDFNNMKVKLIFPRKERKWPFYMSFDLERPGYTTNVILTALGTGLFEDWQSNNYKFDLVSNNLNPKDLGPLQGLLPDVSGLFNLKVSGEGVLKKGIHAVASASIKGLELKNSPVGAIKTASATTSASLMLNQDKVSWNNLLVDVGKIQIRSRGEVSEWMNGKNNVRARVVGKVADLNQISSLLPNAKQEAKQQSPMSWLFNMFQPGKITGNAEFDVRVNNDRGEQSISTDIKAEKIPAKSIMEHWPLQGVGWLSSLISDPNSEIRGELKVDPNNQLEFPDLDVTIGNSVIHTRGYWDTKKPDSKLVFDGENLSFRDIGKKILRSPETYAMLKRQLALPSPNDINLDGNFDLSGTYTLANNSNDVHIVTNLRNADVTLSDDSFSAMDMNGNVEYNGRDMVFKQVTGKMGGGTFTLNGSIGMNRPWCDVSVQAHHIELSELDEALRIMRFPLPILTERQLYGKVKDFTLTFKGNPYATPQIIIAATPEDLFYRPPGVDRALRAVSGTCHYENDELILRNVVLVTPTSRVHTAMQIEHLSGASKLKRLKVRTSSADLADISYYLSSNLAPPGLRDDYRKFIAKNKIENLHGRFYGDMNWRANKSDDDYTFDGMVGFYNAGGKFGKTGYPLEHVAGIIAAAGPELLLQDVSGTIGHTSFEMDGHVNDYLTADASGQIDVRTDMYPDELLGFIPGAEDMKGRIISAKPINVRASMLIEKRHTDVVFALKADNDARVRLNLPFGVINQPSAQPLSLDGSMRMKLADTSTIEFKDSHLTVGDSVIQAFGKYSWTEKPGDQPVVDWTVRSPNPVAAKMFFAALDPNSKPEEIKGTVFGELKLHGNMEALSTKGYLDLSNLTLPQFNIAHVNGRLESPQWFLNLGKDMPIAQDMHAKLHLSTIQVGNLPSKNVNAEVVFGGGDKPRVSLRNGTAEVANGKIKMSGWMDMTHHKIHAETSVQHVDSNQIAGLLMGYPGEITGPCDADIVLDTEGLEYKDLIHNLDGKGSVRIANGKVARFGQLQAKLAQANLLQQGLFGFNLNNLLQSVAPVRTGEFKTLTTRFDIADGTLNIGDLRFNGDDMRLWGAGHVNLPLNTISLDIAGKLPRVSSSLLSGKVGEVSKQMTLQNLLHTVTLHKLENLPPVPILGDLASDKPRTFSFKVVAPIDKPTSIAHSIEKSFHWLPGYPNASAHPVP